ncbi:MAG: hypothetical protein K9L02_07015 [Acholeplasmataceae bacterium]|nr:hypothetical protein [Acholeplasmataceae bacterium]
MNIKNNMKLYEMNHGGISFNLLENGDVFDITYKDNQINLLKGNAIDGSLMNLYLRVYLDDTVYFTRLIGKHSPSQFIIDHDIAYYRGFFQGVEYQVSFKLNQFEWLYEVKLKSRQKCKADVIYGQDIAIQSKSSVLSSEPYTVQYIDYKAYHNQNGYTLCARQNQGKAQFLQIGSLTPNLAYTTDGFQFFGLSYKETGIPEAMNHPTLVSEIYQYEFSYFALQSDIIDVEKEEKQIIFYGLYQPSYEKIIEQPEPFQLSYVFKWLDIKTKSKPNKDFILDTTRQLNGLNIEEDTIKNTYPVINQEERNEGELLSFFTTNNHHVVLKQKELLVERPHGHIMVHGDLIHATEKVMATTNFMTGVFNSHVVLGNTSFNKFIGNTRNPLNVQKISGQRIYIKRQGVYYLLGLPSYYDMGGATTRWVYILDDDVLTIDVIVDINNTQQSLIITSKNQIQYDFIVTQQIVMGVNEYAYDLEYKIEDKAIKFIAPNHSMIRDKYPELTYSIQTESPYEIIDEHTAFGCDNQHGLLILSFKKNGNLRINISASINGSALLHQSFSYQEADTQGTTYFESFSNNMVLNHSKYQNEVDRLQLITFWYTHNALTHYASPHGLEQYNGAAWGTRDVCQGPMELFSATGHTDLMREIILKTYSRQFSETGDFPQWFMFDKYYQIQAHESHGDIIIWPMRSLAYYLKQTADYSILDEKIPFMSKVSNEFTEPASLMDHLKKQFDAIQSSFIKDTHLPAYGGGDWDDTLQPANHELTHKMVSGWTVALLYEACTVLAQEFTYAKIDFAQTIFDLVEHIKKDYHEFMIADGIPAGFVVFDKELTYLLHPKDLKTGLNYRLLPFIRSMIAELADHAQLNNYVNIIDRYLKHPDGVRLMDTTVEYKGGKTAYFARAETAANFGREIGLQYVHAHIRYIEAMAKIGRAEDAYEGLFVINPILIQKKVKNAYFRQSNVYFSSSDAWFKDRYEAKRDFDKIKSQQIWVKGGWRLYSSGPGIYINQFVSNILGIKLYHGNLLLDPILPHHLDGLQVTYAFKDKQITVNYHKGIENLLLNHKKIEYQKQVHPYRAGGLIIESKMILEIDRPIIIDIWST